MALAQDYEIKEQACHCENEPIALSLPKLSESIGASAAMAAMAAISRSLIGRVMIGSTAQRLPDELECDVFIIKPDQLPALNQSLF